MPIVNVASNVPSQVASSAADAFLVRNVGTNTVYLADNQALTTGSYDMSLAAGASLNWVGKRELWAICQNGQTSSMEVIYGGATAISPAPPVSVDNHNSISILPNLAFKPLVPVQNISPGTSWTSPVLDVSACAYIIIDLVTNDTEPGPPHIPSGNGAIGVYIQDADGNAYAYPEAIFYRWFSTSRWIVAPPAPNIKVFLQTANGFTSGNATVSVHGTDKAIGSHFLTYGPIQGGYDYYGLLTNFAGYPSQGFVHWDIPNIPAGDTIRVALPVGGSEFTVLNETIIQNAAGSVVRNFVPQVNVVQQLLRQDSLAAAGSLVTQGLKIPVGRHPVFLEIVPTGTSASYSGNFYMGEMFA